jgi:hypothetical protein
LQKTKTTCSGKKLQGKRKKKKLALEIICRKRKTVLLWKFAESKKTWSESLQKTGNFVSKLAFMI